MRPALLVLVACVEGPGPSQALPLGDAEAFASEVQPVLAAGCANPACHGTEDRPLALYAPQRHRADPARLWLEEPLSEDELARNQARVSAFIAFASSAEETQLLCKPLDPLAGGCGHGGGIQLLDTEEADYQALLAWTAAARGEEIP